MENEITVHASPIGSELVPFDEMAQRLERRREFVRQQLKDGIDYGRVPGVQKPFMWKSGAEKLLELHGFLPQLERVDAIEDRSQTPPYFEFTYRCDVIHVSTGTIIRLGAEGTCNNRERRYYDDRDGTPKGDAWIQRNTVLKMTQKRAVVNAALLVTSLSCDFTQDEEAVDGQQQNGGSGPQFTAPDRRAPPEQTPQAAPEASGKTEKFRPPEAPQQEAAPAQPVTQPSSGGPKASEKQSKYIYALCMEKGIDINDMMKRLKETYGAHVERFDDLLKSEASDVIAALAGN